MNPKALTHILCADDDADMRMILEVALGTLGGWRVTLAADGEETLASARADRPDLILLDASMAARVDPDRVRHRPCLGKRSRRIHRAGRRRRDRQALRPARPRRTGPPALGHPSGLSRTTGKKKPGAPPGTPGLRSCPPGCDALARLPRPPALEYGWNEAMMPQRQRLRIMNLSIAVKAWCSPHSAPTRPRTPVGSSGSTNREAISASCWA